ncbi:MAG: NAD(P)-binding protein, partial [Gammaproteobacteria bacterium]|nr:NAD(P)-binding protein [Gammaproteobacteria bacterium]
MSSGDHFDAIVVGGGPAGATTACELADLGYSVLLLERAARIKPCGGAIPPKLLQEFDIPESILCTRVNGAGVIAPSGKRVDMPI